MKPETESDPGMPVSEPVADQCAPEAENGDEAASDGITQIAPQRAVHLRDGVPMPADDHRRDSSNAGSPFQERSCGL